jgi:hypothetical protein
VEVHDELDEEFSSCTYLDDRVEATSLSRFKILLSFEDDLIDSSFYSTSRLEKVGTPAITVC